MDTKKNTHGKVGSLQNRKVQNTVFFWCIATIPLLLFAFDLIVVNFNSILLAFKEYTDEGFVYYGFGNFSYFFESVTTGALRDTVFRSVGLYLLTLIVTSIIPIIFSYYLYHKFVGSGFFKILLFLPNIISSVATILIFKFLATDVIPYVFNTEGLLSTDKRFTTITIYTLWMQFGSGLLIQLGAMNATEKEVVEASHIDGVGFWGELWHVVLPKSYTILSIGMYTGVISIFTNDFGLYTFYGNTAPENVWTLGYKFLADTTLAEGNPVEYSKLAAWGLCATIVAAPLTFFVKWLVEHIGPSED